MRYSPPAARSREKTCPSCGRIDQVQAVTALVGAHPGAAYGSPATIQKLRSTFPRKRIGAFSRWEWCSSLSV